MTTDQFPFTHTIRGIGRWSVVNGRWSFKELYSPQFAMTRNGPFLFPCCHVPVMNRL
jgi:hypothetical protein